MTNVMEEPLDSSMAATKTQRKRDIRVVAGVFINPFLSVWRAVAYPERFSRLCLPWLLDVQVADEVLPHDSRNRPHLELWVQHLVFDHVLSNSNATAVYRLRENRLKRGFEGFAAFFGRANCKNRRIG